MNSTTLPLERWQSIRTTIVRQLKGLTTRERSIIGVLLVGLAVAALYWFATQVQTLFAAQAERLTAAESAVEKLDDNLGRYVKLKAHRDEIERTYRGVEIKEGVYAHIEGLLRTKLGLSSGFTIKDSPAKDIGRNFEQTTYTVDLEVGGIQAIVEFLSEVVHGPRPLLLSRLEIRKTPRGDKLIVGFDVINIREKSPEPSPTGAGPAAMP